MTGAYLIFLLVAIACLGLIDYRYHLVFFNDWQRAAKVLGVCVALFVAWDLAGIILRIFYIGEAHVLTGLRIGQFPIEELFFLILLNYSALITYRYLRTVRGVQ